MQIRAQASSYVSKWHGMQQDKMYVQTPKHWRNQEHFFRSEQQLPSEHKPMANDEPLVEPKPKPKSNALSEPLEHEHQQESWLVTTSHKNHKKNNVKKNKYNKEKQEEEMAEKTRQNKTVELKISSSVSLDPILME